MRDTDRDGGQSWVFTGGSSWKAARNPKRMLKLGCQVREGGLVVFIGKSRSPSLSVPKPAYACSREAVELG